MGDKIGPFDLVVFKYNLKFKFFQLNLFINVKI